MTAPVLIIDEDESVTRSMIRLLSAHGISVRGEITVEYALRTAIEIRPAVIIVDLHMRECSGIDLAHQMRAEKNLAAARIIGMSATIPDWDAEALAVFDMVLEKPILAEVLLAAIRT